MLSLTLIYTVRCDYQFLPYLVLNICDEGYSFIPAL